MKRHMVFFLFVPFLLSGCAGLALGAGATAGVAAAQEGGIEGAINDTVIRATINDLWFKYDLETFAKLNLTVDQGRVLITGVVQNPEHRVEAVRLAWQAEGVREVINEVKVANSGGITGFARDTWITTRLRTSITFDREVQSINYSIDTVQGVVYLMGVARNQAELNRVTEIARTIPDVKQVVSYVKLAGQPLPAHKAPVNVNGSLTAPQPDQAYPAQGNGFGGGQPETYRPDPYGQNAQRGPESLTPEPVQQEPLGGGNDPGYGGGY